MSIGDITSKILKLKKKKNDVLCLEMAKHLHSSIQN